MFIRYFADTTGSALSEAALEYMRAFLRLAPVRLVSVTGALGGVRWPGYAKLLTTPMVGSFANAVCCDPSRWTWIERVPMGESAVDHTAIGAGKDLEIPHAPEVAKGRVELYTAGVRNILFAVAPPRSKPELETALKYQAIVVPSEQAVSAWDVHGEALDRRLHIQDVLIMPSVPHALERMRALFLRTLTPTGAIP